MMYEKPQSNLPEESSERKEYPLMRGLFDYFPAALAAVAHLSYVASVQHDHGDDMHWERAKSSDHADTALRHLVDRGTVDSDGVLHSVKAAWRSLALAQEECEQLYGAEPGRASRFPTIIRDGSLRLKERRVGPYTRREGVGRRINNYHPFTNERRVQQEPGYIGRRTLEHEDRRG